MSDATLGQDTNVRIPAAVRAASERADALAKAAYPDLTPQGNEPPEGTPPATPPVVAASPPPAAAPPAEPPEDDASWEQKFKSVNGRYTRSQEEVRNLTEQIRNLQNVVATLQAAPPPASEPATIEKFVTEQEVTDYGKDLLDVVGKKAHEIVAPLLKKQADEIARLNSQLGTVASTVQADLSDKFNDTLDEKLPSWREINVDPEFISWLGLSDPYSGANRHEMLKAAYAQGNASRVLAFFNGFLAEEAAVAPAGNPPDAEGTVRVPKIPLENLAAPGRAKTAAPATPPAEKPFITRAQITTFYADVAAGKYRSKVAEKDALEAQIFAAEREGRIR
jgi:hypothetical protein